MTPTQVVYDFQLPAVVLGALFVGFVSAVVLRRTQAALALSLCSIPTGIALIGACWWAMSLPLR